MKLKLPFIKKKNKRQDSPEQIAARKRAAEELGLTYKEPAKAKKGCKAFAAAGAVMAMAAGAAVVLKKKKD